VVLKRRAKMIKSKSLSLLGLFFPLFVFMGCVSLGAYGKMRLLNLSPGKEGMEFFLAEWNDYKIYWAGAWEENPSAVLFDPDDERELVPADIWIQPEAFSKRQGGQVRSSL